MAKIKDITGQQFGYLTAMEFVKRENGKTYWSFDCKCGKSGIIRHTKSLAKHITPSCGCYTEEMWEASENRRTEKAFLKEKGRARDFTGEEIGFLKVQSIKTHGKNGTRTYDCICQCGNHVERTQSYLSRRPPYANCGCLGYRGGRKIGDEDRNRLKRIHNGMIQRCYNKNVPSYRFYGARGITITNSWLGEHGFEHFYDWAINNGYAPRLSIDRIDVNGNYSAHNCQWVDSESQANNKRSTLYIEYQNEVMTIAEFAKIVGIASGELRKIIQQKKVLSGDYLLKEIKK